MLLGESLQSSLFGVFCVTKENIDSPWLLFEAGAIGRSLNAGRVVPILLDMKQSELDGPLAQFQAIEFDKSGIQRLVETLHGVTNSGVTLDQQKILFEALWPRLEEQVSHLHNPIADAVAKDSPESLLREILDEVRGLRIAPDERSILTALQALITQARSELVTLEERATQLDKLYSPTHPLHWAVATAKDRIKRMIHASRAIERGNSHAMKAALVEIVTIADIRKAVKILDSDLEVRQYHYELHGDFNSPAYRQFDEDMAKLEKIDKFMAELGIPAAPEDES